MRHSRIVASLLPVLLLVGVGCVSRNVESLSANEVAARSAPPPPRPAGQAAESVVSAPGIDGTIVVAEGSTPPSSGVIFVIVRVSGREGGAPLAVKQLPGQTPAQFRLTEADSMIAGTPLVGDLDLIVRFDQDGNAFSRQPGDLEGRVGPVQVGGTVEIVLAPLPDDATGS